MTGFSIVIPTIGRPSLQRLLDALAAGTGPGPQELIVVDDRPKDTAPLELPGHPSALVLRSGGRGPAAARNVGWRAASAPWVAFLDDDVVTPTGWQAALDADLTALHWLVAGSQGRIRVPLPAGRRPTDWERNVAGLESARWATADLAYRRDVLEEVGGFDERFPRAFREDADLGLRVTAAGYLIVRGERLVDHPVRPAGPWVSVRLQAGNADDIAMRARWGPGWRVLCGAEAGRTGRHVLTVGGALAAAGALLLGRRRVAAAGAAAWIGGTAELFAARVRPGPGTPGEVATMAATSAVLPFAATGHAVRGLAGLGARGADRARAPLGLTASPLALSPPRLGTPGARRPRSRPADPGWKPAAVLFDRDGTLVVDRPGMGPAGVVLMPGARVAVRRAREEGLAIGVVTNQSVVGRGVRTADEVAAVNRRVEQLVGPVDTWQVCPHAPGEGCGCRKPAPGLVLAAAGVLGVPVGNCVVIGDIGGDVEAARAAGARSVLVPTPATRGPEISAAPVVAPDLLTALDLVLAGQC